MNLLCINDDFSSMPLSTRQAIQHSLPQHLEKYTIKDQLVNDGTVWVELEEIKGFMFDIEKHFILLESQTINQ